MTEQEKIDNFIKAEERGDRLAFCLPERGRFDLLLMSVEKIRRAGSLVICCCSESAITRKPDVSFAGLPAGIGFFFLVG